MKRIFLFCLFVISVLLLGCQENMNGEVEPINLEQYDNTIGIVTLIDSKRKEATIVSEEGDHFYIVKDEFSFEDIEINQKIKVYHEGIEESDPPQISPIGIEFLSEKVDPNFYTEKEILKVAAPIAKEALGSNGIEVVSLKLERFEEATDHSEKDNHLLAWKIDYALEGKPNEVKLTLYFDLKKSELLHTIVTDPQLNKDHFSNHDYEFTEVVLEGVNTSQKNIAMMVFQKYLEGFKKTDNLETKIKDFKVNKIEMIESGFEQFKFSVSYDILPFDWDHYVLAGNGKIDENNQWIKNKFLFVRVEKSSTGDSKHYRIIGVGTGP